MLHGAVGTSSRRAGISFRSSAAGYTYEEDVLRLLYLLYQAMPKSMILCMMIWDAYR